MSVALSLIYSGIKSRDLYGREFWWMADLLSDELKEAYPAMESWRADMLNYQIESSNPNILMVWTGLYKVIERANLLIVSTPPEGNEAIPRDLAELFIAEAKFYRAFCYAQLTTYWGKVPFTLTPQSSEEGIPMTRSVEDVYDQILIDLNDAKAVLPGKTRGDNGRPTIGAADALIGKIHLFRGDFSEARSAFQEIIDRDEYELVRRYEDNHREEFENNPESIFEIQYDLNDGDNSHGWGNGDGENNYPTFRGQDYSPFDWHNALPSESLKVAFEQSDPRYKLTFIEYGDLYGPYGAKEVFGPEDVLSWATEDKTHWRKYGNAYKKLREDVWSGINHRVIRYADILLMMAEVINEQDGPTAEALDYLNQVRDRVSMPRYPTALYPVTTKGQFFEAIMHERQVELASEQVRAWDLKRWLNDGKISSHPNPNYDPKHKYLPIPAVEIDLNPAITSEDQKPGY